MGRRIEVTQSHLSRGNWGDDPLKHALSLAISETLNSEARDWSYQAGVWPGIGLVEVYGHDNGSGWNALHQCQADSDLTNHLAALGAGSVDRRPFAVLLDMAAKTIRLCEGMD